MTAKFFKTPADFRRWLERNHRHAPELVVGFYKKASGKPSISVPEAVDEALCFGWIDGIVRRIDDVSYAIRFSPRRRGSVWSDVNTRRVAALKREKRMTATGLKAFDERNPEKTRALTSDRANPKLPAPLVKKFRANAGAWAFFQAQPPGYRRLTTFWVICGKRDETRQRRLAQLIALSAKGQRLPTL